MILPSARGLRLLAWGAPLWFASALLPPLWVLPTAWLLALLALAALDYSRRPQTSQLEVRRVLPTRLAYDEPAWVALEVTNRSRQHLTIAVRDEVPDELAAPVQIFRVVLPPGAQGRVQYQVKPVQRGNASFGNIWLRARGGLEMLQHDLKIAAQEQARVYPAFRGAADYQLLARIAERQEARRPRRVKGQGSDYESLRPYVPGDDPRLIDWKSSARRGALISRKPQVEKGQQLALLVDSGRLMQQTICGHPRLEHVLNAAVRLSYVVQKRGDSLALAAFSNRIEAFSPSLRGPHIMPSVLELLAQVEGRPVESDYWQVTAKILGMLTRRSLVVLFTEVLDAAASRGLINNLRRAASRHLVLCVVMSEPGLKEAAEKHPTTEAEAWQVAAACDLLRRRRLALETMRSCGILVLDCYPDQLSHRLIRRYLEIRQADLQ